DVLREAFGHPSRQTLLPPALGRAVARRSPWARGARGRLSQSRPFRLSPKNWHSGPELQKSPSFRHGARSPPIMPIIGAKDGTKLPTRSETTHSPPAAEPPADELALALKFARAEKSEATRRAYRSDFRTFKKWCAARNIAALPATPAALAAFLACEARRGAKPSTISRRIAGIRYAHLLAGHEPPNQAEMVKATFRGIRRSVGTAPKRKQPLTADYVRAMAEATPDSLIGLR